MRTIYLIVLLCITAAAQDTLYLTKIVAPDRRTQAWFGYTMSLSNNHLFVGSPQDDRKGFLAGSIYQYRVIENIVYFDSKFYSWNIKKRDFLGQHIYTHENNIFMRIDDVPLENPNFAAPGSVLYYKLIDGVLKYQYQIKSSHPVVAQSFGNNVLYLKSSLLISAHGSRDSNFSPTGAFYQYNRDADSLQIPVRYMGKPNGTTYTSLGENFVANDELLFVSASHESDSTYFWKGCIYVYNIEPDTLIFKEKICSPLEQNRQRFGRTMALSGHRLFVAAPQDDFANDEGRIYVYDITGDSVKLTNVITAPNSSNINYFGLHMVAKGDSLLVGAPQDSSFGWNHGGIYLFQFDENNNYRLERTITLPDSINIVQFPSSLIMTEEFILAGALYDDESRGAVYMFTKEKPVSVEEELPPPFSFQLGDNYPNPFNPVTRIPYQAGTEGRLRIVVYDVLGRELEVLTDEYHPQGSFETVFDASLLSSGIYFYALESGQTRITKKMVLLR